MSKAWQRFLGGLLLVVTLGLTTCQALLYLRADDAAATATTVEPGPR